MDDYNQTLMELGEWQQFGANVDLPVEAALRSSAASENAGSDAVGINVDRPMDAAIGSKTASGDAGIETGGPNQDQSSSPPFLQSCTSQPGPIWFMSPLNKF